MTCHCGRPAARVQQPDPWEGRLDGWCDDCALARCDAYPGQCPNDVGEPVEVRKLSVGDVFEWCGRWVQITKILMPRTRGSGTQRPGRLLYVEVPELGPKRLHYYFDEWVRVRPRNDESSRPLGTGSAKGR